MMRILCVNDSPLTLGHLKRMLKKIAPDAEVFGCREAERAVSLASSEGCDVLVTEIDLAGSRREGLDLARKIKEINPKVNIIFATVYSEQEYADEILGLRISGYITKPFDQKKLADEFTNLRNPVEIHAEA